MAPNECRIDDLARISGVTARNIRADQQRRALLARPLTPVPGGDRT